MRNNMHSFNVPPKICIYYKRGNKSNFTIEKFGIYYHNRAIKVNIMSNRMNQRYMPPNGLIEHISSLRLLLRCIPRIVNPKYSSDKPRMKDFPQKN